MDQIRELGNILQKESPDFFMELIQTDSKKSMLFRAVMESMVSNDNEASMLIYGKIDQGKKYQMLKRNLKEKLISQLNYNNHKNHLNYTLIETECQEKLILASNLLTNNVYHNAEKLLSQVIRKAEAFFLFNILKEAALIFSEISSIKGFPEQVIDWNKKFEKYNTYSSYHLKAKSFYDYHRAHFIHSCSLHPRLANKLEEAVHSVQQWTKKIDSPILHLYQVNLRIYLAYHQNSFTVVSSLNNELKSLLSRYSFLNSKVYHFSTIMHNAKCCLVLGELHRTNEIIHQCLQNYDYKSFLKFEAQALNYSVLMKKGHYKQAGEILNEVFNTYEFSLFYPEAKASWHIRKAYLYFALRAEGKSEDITRYAPEYRSSSIIRVLDQNCKKLSKDKLGYNIQYLIIRLLLTWQNTSEETYYTGKNLQLYYYRNLKDLSELRIKSFVKLLSVIAINEFSEDSIVEKMELYPKEFNKNEYQNSFDINEIIPFEKIFEYLSNTDTNT